MTTNIKNPDGTYTAYAPGYAPSAPTPATDPYPAASVGQQPGAPGAAASTPAPSSDPTIASIYGANTAADPTLSNLTGVYATKAQTPVDEAKIRSDTMARLQAEIDATDRLYAEKLRQAKISGEGRVGNNAAISARRGLLGSDFGAAANDKVITDNNQVYSGIDAERAAAIGAIRTGGKRDAEAEIAAKTAEQQTAAQNYITALAQKTAQEKERANQAAQTAILRGVDLTILHPTDISSIAASVGTTPEQLQSAYLTAKNAADTTALDLRKKQAELNPTPKEKDRYVTLSDGAQLYDTETGTIVSSNAKDFKPVAAGGAGGGAASTYKNDLDAVLGATISTIPTKFGQEQFSAQVARARNDSDKINLIASQVLRAQPAELKTDFANQAVGLSNIDKAIATLDSGTKTGAVNASTQYVYNVFGKDYDPKLAAINGFITAAIQPYRNSVTGAAWGTQEEGEYQQLFGSTKYSPTELKDRLLRLKEILKNKSATGLNTFVNPLGTYGNVFETGNLTPTSAAQPSQVEYQGKIYNVDANGDMTPA